MNKQIIDENEARRTIHKLIVTMKRHRKLFDSMREKTGLGRSAHRMLMILSDATEEPSQTYLAEKLEISTAAVAVMLKKAENDGYILREVNSADTRFNTIKLTDKGKKLVAASKKDFYAIDSAVFSGFNCDEMAKLNEILDKLQKNMEKLERSDLG